MSNVIGRHVMNEAETAILAASLRHYVEKFKESAPAVAETAQRALAKVDRTTRPEIVITHGDPIKAAAEELERRRKDSALEAQACAMVSQYGFFLPGPAKGFLRELAAYLNWNNLKGKI